MDIKEFRQKFPQYNDLSDNQLAESFHAKYYKDMPFDEFADKFGVKLTPDEATDELASKSLGRRAWEGLKGAGETVLQGATTPFAAAYGGLENLAQQATGADAFQANEAGNTAADKITYQPRSLGGQVLAPAAGEAFNKTVGYIGDLGASFGTPGGPFIPQGELDKFVPPETQAQMEAAPRSITEAAVNFGALAGPVHEMGVRIRESRAAKAAAAEEVKRQAMLADAKRLQDQAQAEDFAKTQQISQGIPGELFPEAPIPGVDETGLRSPYNLTPDQIAQSEAEMQDRGYQGDLFNPVNDLKPEPTTEGGPTPRTAQEPDPLFRDSFPLTDVNQTKPLGEPVMRGGEQAPLEFENTLGQQQAANILDEQAKADALRKQQETEAAYQQRSQPDSLPENDARNAVIDRIEEDLRRGNQKSVGPTDVSPAPGLSRTPVDEIYAENAVKQNVLNRIGRSATKGTIPLKDLADIIQRHTTNKFHKLLANLLKKVTDGVHVRIVDKATFDQAKPSPDTAAFYSAKTGHIYTTSDHVSDIGIMLHEGIHAAIARFQLLRPDHPYSRAIKFLWRIVTNRLAERGLTENRSDLYGLTDEREFAAESMTNGAFQTHLKDIILRPDEIRILKDLQLTGKDQLGKVVGPGLNSAWHYMVEAARRILGAKPHYHDALSHMIDLTSNMMEDLGDHPEIKGVLGAESAATNWATSANYDLLHAAPIDEFKEQLKKAGVKLTDKQAQAIFDKHNQIKPQTPLQKVATVTNKVDGLKKLQKTLVNSQTLEEMADEIKQAGDVGHYERYVTDKMMAPSFLMKDHPLYGWAMSQVHRVKDWAGFRQDQLLSGNDPKNPQPGSYNYVWKKLTRPFRAEVNDLGQALNNSKVKLTDRQIQDKFLELHGKMMSADQLQSYKDRIRINQQVLADLNKFLVSEGKEPIGQLPHYWSPSEFKGPFLTVITDGAGGKHVTSSYFQPDIEKIKAALPGYDVRVVEKSRRSDMDLDQIQMLMRMLSNPMREEGRRAVAEAMRRSGFMRHGVKREGATGALGTEGGQKGLKNYEEVSERYIRQAYEYLSNRELDKVYNKLNEFDAPPNVKSMALDMIDTATGGSNKHFDAMGEIASNALSLVSKVGTNGKYTLPHNFLRDLIRTSNRVKTSLLIGFGNLTYLGANLLQSGFAPMKMLALAAEHGGMGTVDSTVATFNAMTRAANTMLKGDSHPDIQMMQKIGALEPTFRYDWTNYADPKALGARTLWDYASGMRINAWVEKNVVRRPAALMMLEMLREIGYDKIAKDPNEIYTAAKRLTDQYMVSMKWYEKAHMFSRSGLLGTAISPLQSFSVTWLGMLREYTKLSASGLLEGNIAKSLPLAAFMAISLYTGGLMGTVGIRDYDNLAKFLNNHFDFNLPTAEELVFKHAAEISRKTGISPTALAYGGLSAATGSSIGTTFSAPSLNGSYAPGLQFLWQAGKAGVTALRATGVLGPENVPNSTEMAGMAKTFLPRIGGWGLAERATQLPGAPVQNSKGTAAGPFTRGDTDWMWRYLGTYSVAEQEAKAKWYEVQRMAGNRQQLLTKSMNRAAEVIISDDNLNKNLPPLFQQLTQQGYQAPEIYHTLASELQRKLVESDNKALGHLTSSRQQQIYLWIQQLDGAANAGYQQQRQ